jgi:hypothetical protein
MYSYRLVFEMLLTLTDIQSSSDFTSALGGIDIAVPARIDGRKTHHTETYIACRLLSTLAEADRLTFPLSVSRRAPPHDRPDVVMRTGNAQVGIEITEAIPEQFAALRALAQKEFPDHWLPVDLFPWDAENLSKDEMRELLRRDARSANGWIGDAPEKEWASFISGVVRNKLRKLAGNGFQLFDENWLAIYDNLPLPHVDLASAIRLLKPLLADFWASVPAFDALFIERSPVIAKVTANASEHFVIRDLWMRQG